MIVVVPDLQQSSLSSLTVYPVILSRGDWLRKLANIKVEYNGAVGYVEGVEVYEGFYAVVVVELTSQ